MFSSVFRVVSKVVTVVAVANTSYDLYKKGKMAYTAYKGSKKVKSNAKKVVNFVKESIKDKAK